MTKKCEPPPELRGVDGWHWLHKNCPVFWIADQGKWDWGNDEFRAPEHVPASYHYIGPVTPPATVAALVEALEGLVSEFGGTIDQYHKIGPDFTHKDGTEVFDVGVVLDRAPLIDAARAALALYREAGR